MSRVYRTVLVPLLLAACQDPADPGPSEDTPEVLVASATYDPESPLTLKLSDGATLEVPTGATSEAGEVTFSRVTCDGVYAAPELPSCLYEVDTELEFNQRFEVTLPRDSDEPGTMVEKGDEGLLPLLDSASGATAPGGMGTTSATATIPTEFAVRDTSLAPPDMRCIDLEFTPCGGEMEGDWELVAACGSQSQVSGTSSSAPPDPYRDCSRIDYLLDYPFEAGGKIEFSDDGGDWTSSWSILRRHQIITASCLDSVGSACGDEGGDCAVVDGLCICDMELTVTTTGSAGSWDAETFEERACVDGDTLTVQRESWEGPYWFVYERK